MATKCPDCGFDVPFDRNSCPECGCPIEHQQAENTTEETVTTASTTELKTEVPIESATCTQTDWAQYVYECGVIAWKAFKKCFQFTGRASRREYWSLALTLYISAFIWEKASTSADIFNSPLYLIILFPMLSVGVRRVHDCGKNGWWSICPFTCFFLFLKKSDKGLNKYGNPNPAKNLLS